MNTLSLPMTQPVRRTFDILKAKEKMKLARKSYADLGRALGMKRQAVGHWFRGRGEPDVQQMKAMAKELGCHWLELVDEKTMVVYQEEERNRLEKMRQLPPDALVFLDSFLETRTKEGVGNK
jgi:transcriptional regulator with XRE-family HTH domain